MFQNAGQSQKNNKIPKHFAGHVTVQLNAWVYMRLFLVKCGSLCMLFLDFFSKPFWFNHFDVRPPG